MFLVFENLRLSDQLKNQNKNLTQITNIKSDSQVNNVGLYDFEPIFKLVLFYFINLIIKNERKMKK